MAKKRNVNPLASSLKNVQNAVAVVRYLRDEARKMPPEKPIWMIHKDSLLFYTEKPTALLEQTERHLRRLIAKQSKGGRNGKA